MPSLLAQLPRNLAALKTKSRSDSTLTASLPLAAVSMPHSAGSHGPDMRGFGDALQRNNGGGTQVGASPAGPARPSAYQRALDVLKQLNALPGVAALIPWPEIDPRKSWQIDMTDPMRILLETCRLGEPLCFLYNSLRPREPLEMPSPESSAPSGFQSFISASMGSLFADAEDADLSRRKRAVSNFLRACRQELQIPEGMLFQISDIYRDEPTEKQKSKILSTIEMVFKQMRAMELYPSMIPPLPIFIPDLNSSIEAGYAPEPQNETETKRLRLLKELLDTERRYVGDLDLLMDYYTALKTSRICSSEELRGIFSNLEELVEFQHRFLVKLEASAASPYERVGLVFTKLEPQLAAIYAPMCVNLERANKIVLSKAAQLGAIGVMETRYELPSYLIKPVQRICRYPLLLQQLLKCTNRAAYPYYGELVLSIEAAKRVVDVVNQKRREVENTPSVQELQRRVVDWKGLQPFEFGTLQLFDTFLMPSLSGVEKSFTIYLFDRVLLCCQTVPLSTASKSARMLGLTEKDLPEEQSVRGTVAIKGHVFMDCVVAVHETPARAGEKPVLKVFWRQPGTDGANESVNTGSMQGDNFQLRCKDPEQCRIWRERIEHIVMEERKRKEAIERQQRLREVNLSGGEAPDTRTVEFEIESGRSAVIDGRPQSYGDHDQVLLPNQDSISIGSNSDSEGRSSWFAPIPLPGPAPVTLKAEASGLAGPNPRRNPFKTDSGESNRLPPPTLPKPHMFRQLHSLPVFDAAFGAPAATNPPIQPSVQDGVSIFKEVDVKPAERLRDDRTTQLPSFTALKIAGESNERTSIIEPGEEVLDRIHRPSVASLRGNQPLLRVKIHCRGEIYALQLSLDSSAPLSFATLRTHVLGKVGASVNGTDGRIKFKDEDGDLINLEGDEDLAMIVEAALADHADKGTKGSPAIVVHVI